MLKDNLRELTQEEINERVLDYIKRHGDGVSAQDISTEFDDGKHVAPTLMAATSELMNSEKISFLGGGKRGEGAKFFFVEQG